MSQAPATVASAALSVVRQLPSRRPKVERAACRTEVLPIEEPPRKWKPPDSGQPGAAAGLRNSWRGRTPGGYCPRPGPLRAASTPPGCRQGQTSPVGWPAGWRSRRQGRRSDRVARAGPCQPIRSTQRRRRFGRHIDRKTSNCSRAVLPGASDKAVAKQLAGILGAVTGHGRYRHGDIVRLAVAIVDGEIATPLAALAIAGVAQNIQTRAEPMPARHRLAGLRVLTQATKMDARH